MKDPIKNKTGFRSLIIGIVFLVTSITLLIIVPKLFMILSWIISILLEGNEIPHA